MRPLALLAALALLVPALLAGPAAALLPPPPARPLLPHAPIVVVGDAGFLALATSGVVGGAGTAADPYVIAGWDIAANGLADAVRLENTRAHVLIRGNALHHGDPGWPREQCQGPLGPCEGAPFPEPRNGIVLVNARNVTIEGNALWRNAAAVQAQGSQAVLRGNAIAGKSEPGAAACTDPMEAFWEDVGRRSPGALRTLGVLARDYRMWPATGVVGIASDLRVEGGEVRCATQGLLAQGGGVAAVRGLEVRDVTEGVVARGGRVDVEGARVANATHAAYVFADGGQGAVRASEASRIGRGAFVCGEGTVARVEGNRFAGPWYEAGGGAGVFVSSTPGCPGDPHADVVGNTIEGGFGGIAFTQSTGSVVGNLLRGGAWWGIYTQWASPRVEGNVVEGYDQGLLLRYHHGRAEGNVLQGNRLGAMVFGDPSLTPGPKPVLRHNSFLGSAGRDLVNTEDAIYTESPNPGKVPLDAALNWWGSPAGPADGEVWGAVAVEPWLAAPPGG